MLARISGASSSGVSPLKGIIIIDTLWLRVHLLPFAFKRLVHARLDRVVDYDRCGRSFLGKGRVCCVLLFADPQRAKEELFELRLGCVSVTAVTIFPNSLPLQ